MFSRESNAPHVVTSLIRSGFKALHKAHVSHVAGFSRLINKMDAATEFLYTNVPISGEARELLQEVALLLGTPPMLEGIKRVSDEEIFMFELSNEIRDLVHKVFDPTTITVRETLLSLTWLLTMVIAERSGKGAREI